MASKDRGGWHASLHRGIALNSVWEWDKIRQQIDPDWRHHLISQSSWKRLTMGSSFYCFRPGVLYNSLEIAAVLGVNQFVTENDSSKCRFDYCTCSRK